MRLLDEPSTACWKVGPPAAQKSRLRVDPVKGGRRELLLVILMMDYALSGVLVGLPMHPV
jgi:hypothetical protein